MSPAPPPSPPPAQLILDISRLVYAAWSRTPKGIPRVELAYAEHFASSEPDRLRFTVLDAFGRLRVVGNQSALAFTGEIAGYWQGDVASTAAHWRVALRALWIHVVLISETVGRSQAAHPGASGALDLHHPVPAAARAFVAHRGPEERR